jgi:hypothetical protein
MVEPARKHGAFDPRYPLLSKPAAPSWVLRADDGLEWTAFLAHFFPGRRRHDIEALAAYGAYRNASRKPSAAEHGPPFSALRVGVASTAPGPKRWQPAQAPTAARTRRVGANAASAAVSVWEGEGGRPG